MMSIPIFSAEQKQRFQTFIFNVFDDDVMTFLAVILIPIIAIPLLFPISPLLNTLFDTFNVIIILAFICEYFFKLGFSIDKRIFILKWEHILDLTIILLALAEFYPFVYTPVGRASPILRLLRVSRLFSSAGRSIEIRKRPHVEEAKEVTKPPMKINQLIDSTVSTYTSVEIEGKQVISPEPEWIDFQYISDTDLDTVSHIVQIPRHILANKINKEAMARIDYFKEYSTIFLRDSRLVIVGNGYRDLGVNTNGMLIICRKNHIFTLFEGESDIFNRVVHAGVRKEGGNFAVKTLYAILLKKIEDARNIIEEIGCHLEQLQELPSRKVRPTVLEDILYLKKEIDKLGKNLWYAKQIYRALSTKKVSIDGMTDEDLNEFDMLYDDVVYLYESSQNISNGLVALREININAMSFEMTRVMRILAIITTLALIPTTIGGLLGENLVDSPWNITIIEIFFLVISLMILALYGFYRKGWLE